MRLFLGIPAPQPENLRALSRELAAAHQDLRLVPDGSWHVTLRFLGDVHDERARDRLITDVADAVRGRQALACRIERLGAFPKPGDARVVWAAAEAPGIAQLAERVAAATALYGRPPDPRPFKSHVTLGRMKIGGDFTRDIANYRTTVFGTGTCDEVVLWSSTLTPQGPRYDRVAAWPLSPP